MGDTQQALAMVWVAPKGLLGLELWSSRWWHQRIYGALGSGTQYLRSNWDGPLRRSTVSPCPKFDLGALAALWCSPVIAVCALR